MKSIKKLLFGALIPMILSCNLALPEEEKWYKEVISPIPIEVVKRDQREIFEADQILIPKMREAHTELGIELENWEDAFIPKEDTYQVQELYINHLENIVNYFYNTTNKNSKIKNSLDKLTYGYIASDKASGLLQNDSIIWLNINQKISEEPYLYPFFSYQGTFFHEATHFFMYDWGLEQKGSNASREMLSKNDLENRINEKDNSCIENFEHIRYDIIFQMQGYAEGYGIDSEQYINSQEPFSHVTDQITYQTINNSLYETACIPEKFMFYFSEVLPKKGENFVIDLNYGEERKCLEFNQQGQAIKKIIQEGNSLSVISREYDEENYCAYFSEFIYPNAEIYWNSEEDYSLGNLNRAIYKKFNKNNYQRKTDVYAQDGNNNGSWDDLYLNEYDEEGNYLFNKRIYPINTLGREISPEELKQIFATGDFSSLDPTYYSGTSTSRIASEPYIDLSKL